MSLMSVRIGGRPNTRLCAGEGKGRTGEVEGAGDATCATAVLGKNANRCGQPSGCGSIGSYDCVLPAKQRGMGNPEPKDACRGTPESLGVRRLAELHPRKR